MKRCLNTPALRGAWKWMFRNVPPLLEEGRAWNVHAAALDWLVDRSTCIRQNRSEDRLLLGPDPADHHGDDQHGQNRRTLAIVSQAVGSSFVWSYLKMLRTFLRLARHMFSWHKVCPCHPLQSAEVQQDFRGMEWRSACSCPMQGLRAAEAASGDLLRFFDEVSALLADEVTQHCAWLAEEERKKILFDFELGKNEIKTQKKTFDPMLTKKTVKHIRLTG